MVQPSDSHSGVKQLIEALEHKFGSLRKAAKALDTNHARLANWRDGQQAEFLDLLERIRIALKIPKAQFWAKIRQGKK